VELAFVAKAAGMFAVTNIDDIVLLALFFTALAVIGRQSG
jgi:cadmium resistance protein CadD (predicted permease)